MRAHDFQPHPFVRDESGLCVTCRRMPVGHDYFALLDEIDRLTRERDEALALVERVAPFLSWLQGWVTDEGGDFIGAATGYEQAAIDIHKAMLNCGILEGDTE